MVEERLPPHNEAAEEAVLGSLLIDPEAVFTVSTLVQPEQFFVFRNRLVYEACLDIDKRGEKINQITVAQELVHRGLLTEAGGAGHLAHVVSTVPTSLHAEYYAQIVARLALMRKLIDAGGKIARIGYDAGPDPDAALAQAEQVLFELRRGRISHDFVPIRDILDKFLEDGGFGAKRQSESEHIPFVLTGFAAVDNMLGGFQRSDLIIVGARPSIGKTSLALCIARNAAVEQKACVAFFSMEMSKESVVQRLVANEADVDSHRLRMVQLSAVEEKKVADATGVLSEAPFYVDDSPQLRVVEMRSRVRRLHNERGIDLVVMDYLQLASGDTRNDNRVQEVSEITRSLKALARELNVPVCVVSQLSRAVMGRSTHKPQLSDLRESGSIEQDADVVIFIHRDDYYYSQEDWAREHDITKEPYPRGIADIIIAKHRNGPTGEVKLRFIGRTASFSNLEAERQA